MYKSSGWFEPLRNRPTTVFPSLVGPTASFAPELCGSELSKWKKWKHTKIWSIYTICINLSIFVREFDLSLGSLSTMTCEMTCETGIFKWISCFDLGFCCIDSGMPLSCECDIYLAMQPLMNPGCTTSYCWDLLRCSSSLRSVRFSRRESFKDP
jgi:hypothetical protein